MKKFLLFAAAALITSSASAKWVSIIEGGKAADGETAALQAGWTGPAKVVDNPKGDGKAFECPIPENTPNEQGNYDDWKSQMFICFNEPVQEGDVIKVTFDHYCTDTRNVGMQAQGDRGGYQGNFEGFETKSEWQQYSQEVTVTAQFAGENGFKTIAVCLSSKPEAATFYVNNVVIEKQVEGEDPEEPAKNVIAKMYPGDASLIAWGADGVLEAVKEDDKDCAKLTNSVEKNPWEVQFAYDAEGGYAIGQTYYIEFDVKGDASDGIGSGFQCTDGYIGCGDMNTFAITPEWKRVKISGTVTDPGDGKSVQRWVASIGKYIGTFYISNLEIYTLGESAVDAVVVAPAVREGVYNLQGVKVADSLDEVTLPGLYIANGKKYIKK